VIPNPTGAARDLEIVTTRPVLAEAIRWAIAEAFSDFRRSGPAPRETTVFHLIDLVSSRVSAHGV
jgi:hypothetical protein